MGNAQNNLEKSISATIAYFDIFNYPLTEVEIWKWLLMISDFRFKISDLNLRLSDEDKKISLAAVQKILENSDLIKSLTSNDRGFYFLKNREELVEIRERRYVLAEKKIKRAKRVTGFLKFIPGIKMIAVCNSLAWTNAREESDIDFFIVTAPNKIWTARFWAAGFLKIFGLRPSGKNNKDKICLSFFVDEDSLELEPLAVGQPDIYLIYWVAQLRPLYDRGGVYQKFWQANAWVKNFLPNIFPREVGRAVSSAGLPLKHASQESFSDGASQSPRALPRAAAVFVEKKDSNQSALRKVFGADTTSDGFLEIFFRWLQMKLLLKSLKEMANRDSRVVITDKILKFHANDRREEYKQKWIKRVNELGI